MPGYLPQEVVLFEGSWQRTSSAWPPPRATKRSRRFSPDAMRDAESGAAHIRTAERTVVSYLVKPVTDFVYRSLREE